MRNKGGPGVAGPPFALTGSVTNTLEKTEYRAYICCGANCGPKGSARLLDVLEEELERQGMSSRVSVLPTGCQSHCETGPTMVVYPGPVYYEEMDDARLEVIVREHFGRGVPVKAFFWTGLRPRRLTFLDRAERRPLPTNAQPGTVPDSTPRQKQTKPRPDVDDFKW